MRIIQPLLALAIALMAVTACWAATPDKPAAAETPTPAEAAAKGMWKIRKVSLSPEGAMVWVVEAGTQKSRVLKSSDVGDTRVLSVGFTAGPDELRAEVLIGGERHTLVQKAAEMEATSRAGPTQEERTRYENLSPKGREKFRAKLREKFSDPEFRSAPESDRRAYTRSLLEAVSKEDEADAAATAKTRPAEPAKEGGAPVEKAEKERQMPR